MPMGSILGYQDVFVAGGFPHHTYNPRDSLQLETKLADSLKNLCKIVVITGHTKSGKTVLARKILATLEIKQPEHMTTPDSFFV